MVQEPLIFLGSGASKPFGIPTMQDFVTEISAILAEDKDATERSLFEDISRDVKQRLGWVDLEAVFSIVNVLSDGIGSSDLGYFAPFYYRRYGRLPPLSGDDYEKVDTKIKHDKDFARRLRKRLETFVRTRCELTDAYFEKLYEIYSTFFDSLARTSGTYSVYRHNGEEFAINPWSIFTTNYDLCIEEFCREHHLRLDTGVHFDDSRRQLIVSTEIFDSGGDRLSLMKLHGSLSWFKQDDGAIIEHYGERQRTFGLHKIVGEVMLYPIREKEMYLDPYLPMVYSFSRRLKLSKVWLIIGYRFNDEILRTMLANRSKNKKIIVVHPRPQELPLDLFGSEVVTIADYFGLNSIPKIVENVFPLT